MRHYHIVFLSRLGLVFLFLGFLLLGLETIEVIPGFGTIWNKLTLGFMFVGILLNFGLSAWVSFKSPSTRGPNSAHVLPVEPKGVWVDSFTALGIGTAVLACSYGKWYRGRIVKVMSRDRYVIRFLGWDPFWDEIHLRSDLQIDVDEEARQQPVESRSTETSFREK